jgi:SET domain-containing protein
MKNSNLYIGISKRIKQRGVFASKDYKKHELIETCPCLAEKKTNITNESTINDYIFQSCYNTDNVLIAFGYCSMYNHSNFPNASWLIKDVTKNPYISIYALNDIQQNEEIFISYGDEYWNTRQTAPILS